MPITLPLIVRRVPKPKRVPKPPRPKPTLPTPLELKGTIDRAAILFDVAVELVMSKSRVRPVAQARQYVFATLTRKHKLTLSEASRYFGYDRDTIRNALKNELVREVTFSLKERGLL